MAKRENSIHSIALRYLRQRRGKPILLGHLERDVHIAVNLGGKQFSHKAVERIVCEMKLKGEITVNDAVVRLAA